ncbi:MAG: EutN/CcmL family microcompartment protein [Fusobacteriaceae bacterium]
MLIGTVIGNVWATRKDEGLIGMKLLVIMMKDGSEIVACDYIGAGKGDMVLISTGSSARKILTKDSSPIDASVIGIIDQIESESEGVL